MDTDLYKLVARELEGRAAQMMNQAQHLKTLARELLEAQGQPAKQRTLIQEAVTALNAYAETLPVEATETV